MGQYTEFKKTVHECDIDSFANISGDYNPVHIDSVAASNSIFKRRVAHGALINAYVSTVLGMYLPGPGTIYLSQDSQFKKPVFIDDIVTVRITISEICERHRARLITNVYNQDGEIVLAGNAYVILPR